MTEDFSELESYLLAQSRRCVRRPVGRFAHPWLAPMPVVGQAEGWGDDVRFAEGDYSGALFHHDVSESAIELCRDPELAEACFGSLLCFLDTAHPNGRVHRIELPFRTRAPEPAKPVMAQLALRAIDAIDDGPDRAARHRVLPRLLAFLRYLERETVGMHGLFLTPSSRASGFDSDILSAGHAPYAVEAADTNTFMVLEYRALAEIARRLADDGLSEQMEEAATALHERIERVLWDSAENTYVALAWERDAPSRNAEIVGAPGGDGIFRPHQSWVSWLPLYARLPRPDHAIHLLDRLLDPAQYWGPAGVRTVPADDPYFHQAPRVMLHDPRRGYATPVSNWSGPIWVLSSFYAFRALSAWGRGREAVALAATTARVLAADLRATGALHECYADDGRGLWPRRGTFISWNVLARTMVREAARHRRSEPPPPESSPRP